MKNYFKYSFLTLLGLAFFLVNCNKAVGPDHLPNLPQLTRAPIPLFTPDTSLDQVIQQPQDFHAAFTISLYFPDDVQPASCDIDVAMNGDYTNIKKLKTGITKFPTQVDVTGDDLAALFGIATSDIKPGYKFELRASFTLKDGTVLPGFANGIDAADASSDVKNFPGSNTTITYPAVCPLDLSAFVGEATVNDTYFWGGSYPVTVTQPSPGVLKVTGVNETPAESMLIYINNKTFAANVPSQMIDANPPFFSYTGLTVSGSGTVNSCENVITLTLGWTVDQGSFGSGPSFVLSK
jgi:hypothetical protein